jgi:transitional endoplasmic reticulum ATPase
VSDDRIDGLFQALELAPDNHAVRLLLAETLREAGRAGEAVEQYERLLEAGALPSEELVAAGELALEADRLPLAGRLLEEARKRGVVDGVAAFQQRLERELADEGVVRLRHGPAEGDGQVGDFAEALPTITFDAVGGLDEVKKTIHRTIILPLRRPDLYAKYGRRAGGGVMMFGPPGCGKTLLARATAGECELPFFNVRIEQILDPYLGIAEGNLHDAFEQARFSAPCVLFLDELDALAFARRKHGGGAGRVLVDQMLQELDSIGSENTGVLILAATNAPWDVDDALKRPGRLDRVMFVPPPDQKARERILEIVLAGKPAAGVDVKRIARETPLFSGADLEALVERAVDDVIDAALESGEEPPLTTAHLDRILQRLQPSTVDWLSSARNYVEFANQGGRYDEVAAFLRTSEARSWRKERS